MTTHLKDYNKNDHATADDHDIHGFQMLCLNKLYQKSQKNLKLLNANT